MRERFFYKLVRVDRLKHHKLTSCSVNSSKFAMTYEPGVWTPAKKYGPLVFSTLVSALLFYKELQDSSMGTSYNIFKCKAIDPRPLKFVLSDVFNFDTPPTVDIVSRVDRLMDMIFKALETGKKYNYALPATIATTYNAPKNTYITSSIMLTDCVA